MAKPARLLSQARRMRRAPAMAERLLWKLLRHRRLEGLKFRRQVPIGRYIADFACFEHRLIVEADGPFHDPAKDAERDAWLLAQGFTTVRFKVAQIVTRPENVLMTIIDATGLSHAESVRPHPSPLAGEGGPRSGSDEGDGLSVRDTFDE
jgi:very-short-patch-repair endonuclease